jgi:hypothetical protein
VTGQVRGRMLWLSAVVVLSVVAAAGAVLSWASLYAYAAQVFGPELAALFPLLVDALVLGASLAYVAGAKAGRPRQGWRLLAHAGVAGTVILNALAADSLASVPLHVTAPLVWSALVELTGAELLGAWRRTHVEPVDRVPLALWWSAPIESGRTLLLMRRTGERSAARARVLVGVHAAARHALARALPDSSRAERRIVRRQLRAGSVLPGELLGAIGWAWRRRGRGAGARRAARGAAGGPGSGRGAPARAGAARAGPRPRSQHAREQAEEGSDVPARPVSQPAALAAPVAAQVAAPEHVRAPVARVNVAAAAPRSPAPGGKRAAMAAALVETGGDVRAAVALLAGRGVSVSRSVAFDVAKVWRESGSGSESESVARSESEPESESVVGPSPSPWLGPSPSPWLGPSPSPSPRRSPGPAVRSWPQSGRSQERRQTGARPRSESSAPGPDFPTT